MPFGAFSKFCQALVWIEERFSIDSTSQITYLEKLGIIHWFEFTHELAWNTLKDFLEFRGGTSPIFGSRDATRQAFAAGLIEDGETWMEMIADRNRTSHTYDSETAEAIFQSVKFSYHPLFLKLKNTLEAME